MIEELDLDLIKGSSFSLDSLGDQLGQGKIAFIWVVIGAAGAILVASAVISVKPP